MSDVDQLFGGHNYCISGVKKFSDRTNKKILYAPINRMNDIRIFNQKIKMISKIGHLPLYIDKSL